ncbi:MAG: sensor histidine kinase [Leptonema sp. (in: bacteria)]
MKTILYRLISIFFLFYFLNLFIFYIFFIENTSVINKQNVIQYFLFFIGISLFIIFLLIRTNNYIVKPIENLIQFFINFPNIEFQEKVNSKIVEIQQLSDYTIDFLREYAQYLEELNIERNLLNSLLNNLKEGVLCINSLGRVIYINEFIKNNFIWSNKNKALFNQNYYEVLEDPGLLDIIFKVINHKSLDFIFFGRQIQNHTFEFRNQSNFYQLKFYLIPKETVPEKQPLPIEKTTNRENEKLYLFIINNITEEYNIKRIKEDFLQNASHELKTPITSIRGYTETLLSKNEIQQNQLYKNFLEGILRNTNRMERIINDMVLISSIESKYYPFNPIEFDIVQFLLELSSLAEGILKQKNIKIEFEFCNETKKITADPLLLEHLFLNLIHNAFRYSEENQKIEILVKEDSMYFIFDVVDYGPGIPDEHKEKIFERFYRIDKDRSRKEGGTGLGLSIVKQIINIHKGIIKVFDNPKGGSIFRIFLPKK